jgi:hypothetical protein
MPHAHVGSECMLWRCCRHYVGDAVADALCRLQGQSCVRCARRFAPDPHPKTTLPVGEAL